MEPTESDMREVEQSARDMGWEAGKAAAQWLSIDSMSEAIAIKVGIDDDDPELLESLPKADLSGQWAGDTTCRSIREEILGNRDDLSLYAIETLESLINDEYTEAFSFAVVETIGERARKYINGTGE